MRMNVEKAGMGNIRQERVSMMIKVEVDCTPDEASQFLGLPDVKPLQTIAMAQLEKQLAEATGLLSPEGPGEDVAVFRSAKPGANPGHGREPVPLSVLRVVR